MDILAEMQRVIDLEVRTINALKPTLGPAYEEAVRWIFDCRGQVVVTGVGKSGIIAQKIAATMVSTGTPALFLHSADGCMAASGSSRKGISCWPSENRVKAMNDRDAPRGQKNRRQGHCDNRPTAFDHGQAFRSDPAHADRGRSLPRSTWRRRAVPPRHWSSVTPWP